MLLSTRRAHKKYIPRCNIITFPVAIPNTIFPGIIFSSTLIEWNNLDINIRNSESYETFKKSILKSSSSFLTIVVEFLEESLD